MGFKTIFHFFNVTNTLFFFISALPLPAYLLHKRTDILTLTQTTK